MLTNEEKNYYSRHLQLASFGEEKQIKLKQAKVLIIGAGGLASPCLQYLAAAGIGKLCIVDGDKVNLHNLHRQTIFSIQNLGKNKAQVSKEKLQNINPFIQIECIEEYLNLPLGFEIFPNYDVIIDCTDNFSTRYLINDLCVYFNKPMVYGAIDQFSGQVSIFNYQNGPTYRCLFPAKKENANLMNCNEAGVLGILPGIIGSFQALECIKLISGIGDLLSGKLMIYQTLNHEQLILNIQRKSTDYFSQLKKDGIKIENFSCETAYFDGKTISNLQQMENTDFIYLDVRNGDEYPKLNSTFVFEIPLPLLEEKWDELPKDKKILCFCKSGIRSKQAAILLQKYIEKEHIIVYENQIEALINEYGKRTNNI